MNSNYVRKGAGRYLYSSEMKRDIGALGLWVSGTAVVALWLLHISYQVSAPAIPSLSEVLARFARFDYVHFDDIARLGYLPEPGTASTAAPLYAFFPAMPMLLRLGGALGLSTIVTGLSVSAIAGIFATIWIRRIADLYVPGLGLRAAAVFVLAPCAIFLYAPYTESLFLAFGLGSWYFGKRGDWLPASVLCGLSCTVRISGAFLLSALFVLWMTQNRSGTNRQSGRHRYSWLYLAIPASVLAGWMGYLALATGDLLAYSTAQKYWGRHLEWPWVAFQTTINSYPPTGGIGVMGLAEVIALISGVIVTIVLVWRRLYGEGVFVGLNIVLLGTSSYFYSVPRSALLWWPLWIGIAYLLRKSAVAFSLYLAGSAAVMLWWANLFLTGQWAG
ncbi:hypothetical protein J2M53_00845 [Arthrobacter sp. zg-ZUI100]|uniref:mannosyltransferase family protein n=1 Tax=Arthrobacter jiangjiafuii TaxID=2817475 RepID=UPI001AEDAA7B|nr:mannosyltransferase family protein [Arthrobacter jiangjiafuii]MBP3034801.1 hypothetical protein [Arthrobacter jiangjiafuii]